MRRASAQEFGKYLKHLRETRNLSIRELARRSSINGAAITRLEHGKHAPRPETLRALAPVLEVSMADLFARAGYVRSSDLPSVSTYLRTCYGDLSDDNLASIDAYIRHLIEERGLDPNGPAAFEDEASDPSQE